MGSRAYFCLMVAEQGVDLRKRFDFVTPQLDAIGVVVIGGEEFNDVAAHPESAALEVGIGALVKDLHQFAGDVLTPDLLSFFEEEQHSVIGFRRAQAIDAAHGGDDDAVAALEQRLGGRQAQLVEFVVDGRLLLDIDVAGRNVGFGLVVVVVGDEVLDRIVREEAFELVIKLRRQRLVVRQNERRTVDLVDELGHREGLAGAGDAQQHLVLLALERVRARAEQ